MSFGTCETVVVNGVRYNKGEEPKKEKKEPAKRGRKKAEKAD